MARNDKGTNKYALLSFDVVSIPLSVIKPKKFNFFETKYENNSLSMDNQQNFENFGFL